MSTVETLLADFAHRPVTGEDARRMMRLSVFDWAACGIAGADEPVAAILRDRALSDGGRDEAAVIGGGRLPARAAAVVNGTISHALDYDDTHFAHIGHASVGVLPAALAMAEVTGADMATMVDAALVGVESAVRVGVWLGRGHYELGFHQTATAGAFGATLAAARLLRLDPARTVAAVGLAATRASGLKSQFGTMGKPYNAGLAAETGVESARLAAKGFTSSPTGLSGGLGFGPTHAGIADLSGFDGIGQRWLFETVSHKFHACCHGLHAMIEAVLASGATAKTTDRVQIRTNPRWMTVCNQPAPVTGLEAKFSYRLTCAMALSGVDTSAIGVFTDATAARPDLIALRDRVYVIADAEVGEMASRVTIHRTDGQSVTATFDLDAPISLEARETRLRRKGAGLLGATKSDRLFAAAMGGDLSALIRELA